MYKHLMDDDLLTPNQSGFRPGESKINELLYVTHKIFTAFEDYPARKPELYFWISQKRLIGCGTTN